MSKGIKVMNMVADMMNKHSQKPMKKKKAPKEGSQEEECQESPEMEDKEDPMHMDKKKPAKKQMKK